MHSDTTEKQNNLFFLSYARITQRPFAVPVILRSIVHHLNLVTTDAVSAYYDAACVMADGNYRIRTFHALSLDIVDDLVDMFAAAVEFRRVNVNNERLAAH